MIYINNDTLFLKKRFENNNYIYTENKTLFIKYKKIIPNLNFIDLKKNIDIQEIEIIKDYFSNISKINNNHYYWSSELSSKNRFTTNIANNFYKNYFLIKKLLNLQNDNVLIYTDDFELINSIIINIDTDNYKNYNNFNIIKKSILLNTKSLLSVLKKFINEIKILLKITINILSAKLILNKIDKNKKYNIIKTHTYFKNLSLLKNEDIFFGKFENYLKESNLEYFKIAHFQDNFFKTLLYIKKNKINVYPYEYFLTIHSIFLLFIIKIFFKIKINHVSDKINLNHLFINEYKKSGISLNHLSFYQLGKNISAFKNIQRIFITYENVAWENALIFSIKKYKKDIKIIGYQHTVVPQASIGMFVNNVDFSFKPLPNIILTNGLVTKNIIEKYSNYPNNYVKSSCALRFKKLNNVNIKKNKIKNILVVLEGIPYVIKLIYVIKKFAIINKNYNIIIRTHPVLPWTEIKNIINNKENLNNISISEQSPISEDFNKSDLCVYWGSAVCLDAIQNNIPVVHFDEGKYLSYDPLFELKEFKWLFTNENDLISIINEINNMDFTKYKILNNKAKLYINNYLHEIKKENLYKFINI